MVAAGIEGGSLPAVEANWSLDDVAAIRRHWRKCGPPAHIALAVLSAAWGNKLTFDEPDASDQPKIIEGGIVGPSISELASMMQVRPGCDTLDASRLITQRLLGTDAPTSPTDAA